MSNGIVTPSTKMLPMEDIKNVLVDQYGFTTLNDNAKDTNKVAGVDSDLIAISAGVYNDGTAVSYDSSGNAINPDEIDRTSVNNALNLGGKPAAEYITATEASDIRNFGANVSEVSSQEIRLLRDELYQLKGELARQGLVQDTPLYQGFQDYFRTDDIKYAKDPVCGILQNSLGTAQNANVNTIYPGAPTEFNVGDYFVIHKKIDEANNFLPSDVMVRVTNKNMTLGEITFDPPTNDLYMDNIELYKSLGQYTKGSFSFSKIVTNAIMDQNEKYTMLNDDTNTTALSIKTNKAGYATKFKIPDSVAGALSKFTIQAKAVGSPGALICYVLKPEAATTLRTMDQAIANGDVVGQSRPVQASTARLTTMINFDFTRADGTPTILAGQQYCFVIEAQYANAVDFWEVTFCKFGGNAQNGTDLQRNNVSYIYKEVTDASPTSRALDDAGIVNETGLSIVNYDILFILATKEVAAENESPFISGLYTTKKFRLPSPIEVSRARLTMRINREGCYEATSQSGVYTDGSSITIAPEAGAGSYTMSYGSGIAKNDTIIAGRDIRTVSDASTFILKLAKGAFVEKHDPVYKLGYEVFLRCNQVEWDETTCAYVTKYAENDSVHPGGPQLQLPLTAIMPDGNKVAPNYSERLIFEGEVNKENNIPVYANEFELQIVWNSGFQFETLNNFKELIGRIFDMTLSFDKAL